MANEEKIDLLIEVTKANIEVTKFFTEVNVKQNDILKNMLDDLKKITNFIEKDDDGLSKKLNDGKIFVKELMLESFNIFFWKILGILTFVSAIISALYYFITFPVIKEMKEELTIVKKDMNNYSIQIIQQNEELKRMKLEILEFYKEKK